MSSIAPLIFVIGVSVLREGIEDIGRHKEDKKANSIQFYCVSEGGEIIKKKSQDIEVGEAIILYDNEMIPADIILAGTANPNGSAYIQTASLDG